MAVGTWILNVLSCFGCVRPAPHVVVEVVVEDQMVEEEEVVEAVVLNHVPNVVVAVAVADQTVKEEEVLGANHELWSIDEDECGFGNFSMASIQATAVACVRSQVEIATRSVFAAVYDGLRGSGASQFLMDNMFDILKDCIVKFRPMSVDGVRGAAAATRSRLSAHLQDTYPDRAVLDRPDSYCVAALIWHGTLFIWTMGESRAMVVWRSSDEIIPKDGGGYQLRQDILRGGRYSLDSDLETFVALDNGVMRASTTSGSTPSDRPAFAAEPSLYRRVLENTDKAIVLASPGFWDVMTKERVLGIAHTSPPKGMAKCLLNCALTEIASRSGISIADLNRIAPGEDRAAIHKDIAVIVVCLSNQWYTRGDAIECASFSGFNNDINKSLFSLVENMI